MNRLTRDLFILIGATLLFGIGLADWVVKTHYSHYILMFIGLAVGGFAVRRIQKSHK